MSRKKGAELLVKTVRTGATALGWPEAYEAAPKVHAAAVDHVRERTRLFNDPKQALIRWSGLAPRQNWAVGDALSGAMALPPEAKAALDATRDSCKLMMMAADPEAEGDDTAMPTAYNQLELIQHFKNGLGKTGTPHGDAVAAMTLQEYLARLTDKRWDGFYSDGRLTVSRAPKGVMAARIKAAIDAGELDLVHKALLESGSLEDKELWREHITMLEGAVSHFAILNADLLAFGNGQRTAPSNLLWLYAGLQPGGSLLTRLQSSHRYPVNLSYIVGPDLRNGLSLHPDALMCIEFVEPSWPVQGHAKRRDDMLAHPGFAAIAPTLYGDDHAGAGTGRDTIRFKCGALGDAIFYRSAYKHRIKVAVMQSLMMGNFGLRDKGVLNLAGMGLGAFGIEPLTHELERAYIEAVHEVLNEVHLPNVHTINLLNFPSFMTECDRSPGDIEYFMDLGLDGAAPFDITTTKNSHIDIKHRLGGALAEVKDEKHVATLICGDAYSDPGNEGNIYYIPAIGSSDESVKEYDTGLPAKKGYELLSQEEKNRRTFVLYPDGRTELLGDYLAKKEKAAAQKGTGSQSLFKSTKGATTATTDTAEDKSHRSRLG